MTNDPSPACFLLMDTKQGLSSKEMKSTDDTKLQKFNYTRYMSYIMIRS